MLYVLIYDHLAYQTPQTPLKVYLAKLMVHVDMTDQVHVQESLFSADYGIKLRRKYMIASMFVTFNDNLCAKYCFSI